MAAKIRINELARELEVKAHEILDRLPELGVTEKKTHSSSIDDDVALKLRKVFGFPVPDEDTAREHTEEAPAVKPEIVRESAAPVAHHAETAPPPPAEPVAAPENKIESREAPAHEERPVSRPSLPIRPP